jgi:hypothetical protein
MKIHLMVLDFRKRKIEEDIEKKNRQRRKMEIEKNKE